MQGMILFMALSSRKLSLFEEKDFVKDHNPIAFMYFLERYCCYVERYSLKIFTYNQTLKNLFAISKITLSMDCRRYKIAITGKTPHATAFSELKAIGCSDASASG